MASRHDPLKTPWVGVFNKSGKMISQNFGDGDIIVTQFRYKYDDEDDDICTIKMQMSDPQALDQLDIQRGTELRIVWGYLKNVKSPEVTVVVRDMISKYGPNVIYTDLECTDYLTFIKTFRSPDVDEISILDYLKGQAYGKYKIVLTDRGENIYTQRTLKKQDKTHELHYVQDWDAGPEGRAPEAFDPILRHLNHNAEVPEGTKVVISPIKKPEAGVWYVSAKDPVREFLEQPISIPTANRSIYIVLQDILKKCPNGPWYVTGRGDTLEIHNRNLGGDITREYIYKNERAQLLDFQAKTKFEAFEKQSISYSGMDAADRKNYYVEDYRKALMNQRDLQEILEDKKITDATKEEQINDFLDLYEGGYNTYKTVRIDGAFIEPGTESQMFIPGRFPQPFISNIDQEVAVKDKTFIDHTKYAPGVKAPESLDRVEFKDDLILRASWYTIPLLTRDEAINVTNNRQRELAMEKEEGKIIVEGDPYLMDQQKVIVSNVHSQHEGQYYIKKCEHAVTQNGYKTTLDCLKVVPEATLNNITTLTKEAYEGGELTEEQEEYYIREIALYGNNVIVTGGYREYGGSRQSSSLSTVGIPAHPSVVKEDQIKLSDLYNPELKWTRDAWITEVLRINRTKDAKITQVALDPAFK